MFRCKFITNDNAVRYGELSKPLPRVVFALYPTHRIHIDPIDLAKPILEKRREYELYGNEGDLLIYREII